MSRITRFGVAIIGAVAVSVVASAQNTGPVIDSVSMRKEIQRFETIYPEFHFHDPSGTVRFIHRELTATNSPKPLTVRDGVIEISPEQQMRGAVYTGGWPLMRTGVLFCDAYKHSS